MNILHHPHLKIENSPNFYDNLNDPFSFMWLVTISTIFFLSRIASPSKDCHLGKKLFSSPENTAFCSCKIWASCLYPLLFKSSPVWLSQEDTYVRKLYLHSSTDLADVRDEELMTSPVSRESPTPAFFDPVSWFPNRKVAKCGSASQEKCEMVRLRTNFSFLGAAVAWLQTKWQFVPYPK